MFASENRSKLFSGERITGVDSYIERYNNRRSHEMLDYKKPMNVCRKSIKLKQKKKNFPRRPM